ncbi:cysteine methyltransferase [Staphylococcus microti]|uniref:methylated-DNA--[protein]-cysteine S-methyltransferase n=1 Tax=Staphylococcus microti TaxID=569857 RepID=A0A0D6XQK7_9STAP|nr:methylated-DNA--[protein]-cysteine S-methyltransferase [Staphylococcus microti]KIX90501.1 cysteine methyltransferase [Staphylococcus microti]PNZ83407.1 methylated-DNA--[protein]-cysteine S-methyltransferase [Staphylococcus microti]SUM57965.1 methylated-DNA--protein-cysteine methyltransferase [Staphylococcus microti]
MYFYYQHIETPLGRMTAIVNDHALLSLSFTDSKDYDTAWAKFEHLGTLTQILTHPIIHQIANELEAYFHGTCQQFKTPVDYVIGTPFQQSVWHALKQLGYGEQVTYSTIATAIGKPKSVRAVASAIGLNPLSIIVPCHRVLRKDGRLGGFNSGIHRKKYLLTLEGGRWHE